MFQIISPITIWLVIGVVLIVLEIILPGFIAGFFGLGAIITCITTRVGLTLAFSSQVVVFATISVSTLILFHNFWKRDKDSHINFSIEIGKSVSVTEFIDPESGGGKVKYQGSIWNATCKSTIPPGESVKIVGYNNLTLIVEKLKKGDQ